MTHPEHLPFSRRFLEALVIAAGCSVPYAAAGEWVKPTERPIATPLDAAIPFVPETIWLYLPGYALLFVLTLWAVRRADHFRAAGVALLTLAVLAAPFFVLFPVAGPRPPAPADPDVVSAMIRWLHQVDPVGNTFPSLHVANATLCAWIAWQADRRVGAVVGVLAVGVALSTLTLKQHWVVDVPAGIALALLGIAAWRRRVAAVAAEAPARRAEPAPEVVARPRWTLPAPRDGANEPDRA